MKELAFQNIWICVKYTMRGFWTSRKDRTIDTDQPKQMPVGDTYHFSVRCLSPNDGSKYDSKCTYICIFSLELYFVLLCVWSLRQSLPFCLTPLGLPALHVWVNNIFPFDFSSTGLPSSARVIPEHRRLGGGLQEEGWHEPRILYSPSFLGGELPWESLFLGLQGLGYLFSLYLPAQNPTAACYPVQHSKRHNYVPSHVFYL